MQRRTFLKESAIGIGTLAGIHTGVLRADGAFRAALLNDPAGYASAAITQDSSEVWGTNAAVLKAPWATSPSLEDLLADEGHSLVFNSFYRVGGENLPATPTDCRISYSDSALFVVFHCKESNMSFPYANLDPENWREVDWNAMPGLPSGSQLNWPPYPDEVDLFLQPNPTVPSYYQFAATLQGLTFGRVLSVHSGSQSAPDHVTEDRRSPAPSQKLDNFTATVVKRADAWLAVFQIPWEALGGKPETFFGLLPMRTRWRDGEFSSPVALDVDECLPVDLLIEMHFSGTAECKDSRQSLCHLPSEILRWQRPAVTTYPDVSVRQQIWEMETSLSTPTNRDNLCQRLNLTQRWMDLLMQEGFTPLPRAWGNLPYDLTLAFFRQRMNAAFQRHDVDAACKMLDTYLRQLDTMSRWWYADGSPTNILKNEWKPITAVEHLDVQDKTLLMQCLAGDRKVVLHLALPTIGGVRIYGDEEGYWKPEELLALNVSRTSRSCKIEAASGTVVVDQEPFVISFYDASGKKVTEIGKDGLCFRFGQDGSILATDVRSHLDPNEVIFGFGERYDHFDENGNVLTLWGTDNWTGNGEGLANTTYKPLPIFHSSKAYMVFDNSPYRLRADIGRTVASEYRLTQHGPIFDYYFWLGSPENTLACYTALTGRPPLPPKWVFEPWMGRGGGAWASGPLHNPVAEEQNTANRFGELDIPHSAIYAEGPSALSPELNQFMTAKGIRVLGYFMPEIGLSRQEALMPELKSDEFPVLQCGTEGETQALSYIDFTNPNSVELCRRELKHTLELGVAGSMVDYGDMVPDNAVFYGGQHGAAMHNFYYYDYQRTISQVFQEKRGNDFILYARGAAPGTQRWVGQFAGDHPANFNGLRHVISGALNLCACGFSTWGSDLGGYFGLPQPAVYMRWFQFGCFSPLMRPHGTAPRDPWYFGDAAVANYKFLAWTRENLLNYIYNSAAVAHSTGVPIMRAMAVAFPNDMQALADSDQYMFGPELLVAPVTNEDTFRDVQFPTGTWTCLWDGKTVVGPAKQKVNAPLDTIPVYLRPGAVVPVQLNRELQFGRSMTKSRIDALVVTPPNEHRAVSLLNSRGEDAKVALQSEPGRFRWTLKNLPETRYLLLYGCAGASSVKVNGKVLPRSASTVDGSAASGWEEDQERNRLVISIPPYDVEHYDPTAEIEVFSN